MKFHLATIYHNYYSNLLFKNITEKLNKAHLLILLHYCE